MRNTVISWKNMPWKLPVGQTVLIYLLLENLAPKMVREWYIVLVTLFGLYLIAVWVTAIIGIFSQTTVDIFSNKK